MEGRGDEIETKNESFVENITDKIHHHVSSSSSSSDSDSEQKKVKFDEDVKKHRNAPFPKSKSNRLFGRERPVHQVFGGGKPFVALHTVPVLYEKCEDEVDAFAEKAMIEIKKRYAVFDEKVLSKIPRGPLKDKKRDWKEKSKFDPLRKII